MEIINRIEDNELLAISYFESVSLHRFHSCQTSHFTRISSFKLSNPSSQTPTNPPDPAIVQLSGDTRLQHTEKLHFTLLSVDYSEFSPMFLIIS